MRRRGGARGRSAAGGRRAEGAIEPRTHPSGRRPAGRLGYCVRRISYRPEPERFLAHSSEAGDRPPSPAWPGPPDGLCSGKCRSGVGSRGVPTHVPSSSARAPSQGVRRADRGPGDWRLNLPTTSHRLSTGRASLRTRARGRRRPQGQRATRADGRLAGRVYLARQPLRMVRSREAWSLCPFAKRWTRASELVRSPRASAIPIGSVGWGRSYSAVAPAAKKNAS